MAPGSPAYAALCVAVPLIVGALMYRLFDAWDAFRRRQHKGNGLPLVDYSI